MIANIKQLSIHGDERGYLTEIFRSTDDTHGFGQAYITTCSSGVIKAWHKHKKQVDRWFCVKGSAKVGLFNEQDGTSQTVILSESMPLLLTIPSGIYHGFTPCWGSPMASILNIPSEVYDYQNPDEQRMGPFDLPYNWFITSR